MSVSRPTRRSAFGLRRCAAGREHWSEFASLDQLALSLFKSVGYLARAGADGLCLLDVQHESIMVDHGRWGIGVRVVHRHALYEAFSPSGRALPVVPLLLRGQALTLLESIRRRDRWRFPYDYCGTGPVPGVHKRCHGGGHRRLRSSGERRLNALVLREQGEVAARAARRGKNLPDSRDDYSRCLQRCWKSQRKGRKAWDRSACRR